MTCNEYWLISLSEEALSIDEIIQNFDDYLAKYGQKKVCDQLIDLGGLIELFDERVGLILELISKHCGKLYAAKFKQTLRARLLAYGSPVTPEFISTFGVGVSSIISEVLDVNVPLTTLKRDLESALKKYGIKIESLPVFDDSRHANELLLSELFWRFLSGVGVLEHPEFLTLYLQCFNNVSNKLSLEKAVIAVRPIFYIKSIKSELFEAILRGLSENFNGLLGFSIATAHSIISYILRSEAMPAISVLLTTLRMDPAEMLAVYERAYSGNSSSLLNLILNKVVALYYKGPIFKVIDAILNDELQAENAIMLLLNTSFATASAQSIEQIIEFILKVSEKLASRKEFEKQIFNLIIKIAYEAPPAAIRQFLESIYGKNLLIEFIRKLPSRLLIIALNRLITTYASTELEKIERSELLEFLDKTLPDWRQLLDTKTIRYLGIV